MKKIVSIVAAVAMASAMFAGEPAINTAVTEFKGSASVTWGINLDTEKTGFDNSTSASLKVNFVDGGDKVTESDEAIWGEIKIKTDGMKAENGALSNAAAAVDYAKLHVGPAWVQITGANTKVGGFEPVLATSSTDGAKWGAVGAVGTEASKGIEVGYAMDKMFSVKVDFCSEPGAAGSVKKGEKLVAHVVNSDEFEKLCEENVKAAKPADKKYFDEDGAPLTGSSDYKGMYYTKEDVTEATPADGMYSDQYAAAVKVTFDMVENLAVEFGVSKNFTVGKKYWEYDSNDLAYFGKAEYKLAIGDKYYVKPQVGATLTTPTAKSISTSSVFAVLFGWGAEKQDTNIKYMGKKVSDGVSVAMTLDNFVDKYWYSDKENGVTKYTSSSVLIGAWDSAKLVPNLTFGAEAELRNVIKTMVTKGVAGDKSFTDYSTNRLDETVYVSSLKAEAKYKIDLDGKSITPAIACAFKGEEVNYDLESNKDAAKKKDETKDGTYHLVPANFYLGVNFDGFVPFTTFDIDYESARVEGKDWLNKGKLNFKMTIGF